jgi:hypothetical protein
MASDMATAVGLDEFRVGNVLSRAVDVLFRHILPFALVAAISHLPNLMLLQWRTRPGVASLAIFGLFFQFVTQAIIYHAAYQDMRGQPFQLNASVGRGIRRFFPIFGTSLCMGFVVMVGMILLVVPGIMLAAALAVAIPVCVIEGLGPFASLRRSRYLTEGYRWKLFGIFLLLFVPSMVLSGLGGVIQRIEGVEIGALFNFITQTGLSAFGSVLLAVIYHDLRAGKDGLDTSRIAAVFD